MVLAGGRARRLDGVDKPGLAVGGRTLLDLVLDACVGAEPVIVVGLRRATARPVSWQREEPRYAGPAAALAAGLVMVPESAEFTAVLAADLPGLRPSTLARLLAAVTGEPADTGTGQRSDAPTVAVRRGGEQPGARRGPTLEVSRTDEAVFPANRATSKERAALVDVTSEEGAALAEGARSKERPTSGVGAVRAGAALEGGELEGQPTPGDGAVLVDRAAPERAAPERVVPAGAVLVDGGGRRQWLCGVWRTVALRAAVVGLGDPTDRAVRAVLGGLAVVEVVAVAGEAADVDTPGDLRALAAE